MLALLLLACDSETPEAPPEVTPPPEAPAPVCMALTVSSTAPRISDTRMSEGGRDSR